MKKNEKKDQEQKRKPRRLGLNRETIQVLNDPAFLEKARGAEVVVCPTYSYSGESEGPC